jgi:two-component system nitrate/nitrite response regulator NarL
LRAAPSGEANIADVWVVDVITAMEAGPTAIAALRAHPRKPAVVLLVDDQAPGPHMDMLLARVTAVAEKRRRIGELLNLLDLVHAGEPLPARSRPSAFSLPRSPTDQGRPAVSLSPREYEVLSGLVRGEDTQELARSLDISVAAVRSHVQNVLMKLGARTRLGAVTTAIRMGLVQPGPAMWQDDRGPMRGR